MGAHTEHRLDGARGSPGLSSQAAVGRVETLPPPNWSPEECGKAQVDMLGGPLSCGVTLGMKGFPHDFFTLLRLSQALQILPGEGGPISVGWLFMAMAWYGLVLVRKHIFNFKQSLPETEALGVPV